MVVDHAGFERAVLEFEEYLVFKPSSFEVVIMCRDILVDRHESATLRSLQDDHNRQMSEKQEVDYQKSIRDRIVAAEQERERTYGNKMK